MSSNSEFIFVHNEFTLNNTQCDIIWSLWSFHWWLREYGRNTDRKFATLVGIFKGSLSSKLALEFTSTQASRSIFFKNGLVFIISCFLLRYTSCPYSINQQSYESSFSPKNDKKRCSKYNVFCWEPCWSTGLSHK